MLVRHAAEEVAQKLMAILHSGVTRVQHMSQLIDATCCVFSCIHDGAAVRPSVNAGGAIFCNRDRRELVVRGGWLTRGCSMPCSRAHSPSVIARSPMRTRNEEPAAMPRGCETPGAMRGEVERSTCSRVGGGETRERVCTNAATFPLPLPLPPRLSTARMMRCCPSSGESRCSGGGEGGAKLSMRGVSTAPPTVASDSRGLRWRVWGTGRSKG
jgi:hypothetical protein